MADWRHGIDQLFAEAAIVEICRGDPEGKRDALGICEEVALAPRPAAIGRGGAGLLTPLVAATDALSTQARLQSMASAMAPAMALAMALAMAPGWPLPGPSGRAGRDAAWSRCRQPATRATAARRSSPNRSPSPGQHLPREAALQHNQNAAQRRPVRQRGPAALRSGPLRWPQRFANGPELIR